MSLENEIKAIPTDVENIVKGDIKLGKTKVPKVAVVAGVVGVVAFIALKSRKSSGGSNSLIPSYLQGQTQLGSDGSTASVPNSSQSALDSVLGNTTPPDASGIPLPNIPLPDLGTINTNLPSLPSLPDIQLPTLPATDFSMPSVPYLSPDYQLPDFSQLGSNLRSSDYNPFVNTGFMGDYNSSSFNTPSKLTPKPTQHANIPTSTKSSYTGSKLPTRGQAPIPTNTGVIKPNPVLNVVQSFVNGVLQFNQLAKKVSSAVATPKPTPKPTVPTSKPPVTYNPLSSISVPKPTYTPVYNPLASVSVPVYKPAPLPPPTNYNPYSKQSSTAVANKTGSPVKVAY